MTNSGPPFEGQAASENLQDTCRRFGVRRLDLFGSAATGGFDPARGDLDFLVVFEPRSPVDYADAGSGYARHWRHSQGGRSTC